MRYRPAINRPGRNLPSTTACSGNAEDRDEELREPDAEGGRGGSGELTVAKSSVGTSSRFVTVGTLSVFGTGRPHDEQKRTLTDNIVPQDEQVDIILRYSLPRESGFRVPACGLMILRDSPHELGRLEPKAGSPICYHPKRCPHVSPHGYAILYFSCALPRACSPSPCSPAN